MQTFNQLNFILNSLTVATKGSLEKGVPASREFCLELSPHYIHVNCKLKQ